MGKIYVIEFQKRGFPHAHILVTLDFNDRPKTTAEFDTIISCEIPDKDEEPELYKCVKNHHLHLCGKWCQDENGECHYNFRFNFCDETTQPPNGRVLWKRPDNGRTIQKKTKEKGMVIYNNRDVVPCIPCLLLKYDCHMFWDICTTKMASVRYLFSYVFKGEDRAALKVTQQEAISEGIVHEDNEIELYQSGRLVCAEEAFWRIIGFNMVEISPPSEQLPVILEGDETVVIPNYVNEQILTEHASDVRSRINNQLQAFFELNIKILLFEKDKITFGNHARIEDLFIKMCHLFLCGIMM